MSKFYIQINAMCLILLLMLLITLRTSRGRGQLSQILLDSLIIITAVMCVSDALAWYYTGRSEGIFDRVILQLSNMMYYGAITAMGYVWLLYVKVRTRPIGERMRNYAFVAAIPLLVMLVIISINPRTGWLFTLDENNEYARAGGVVIHWIISYGYLLLATVLTFVEIVRAESKPERESLIPMLTFIVWPVIGAVLQMIFYGISATQCGITLGILLITLRNLQSEITTDILTGLNNRAAFDKYITEKLRLNGQDFSILVCDVDRFKTINDSFGHAVGDLALKCVAKALRHGCSVIEGGIFLCRFGGDEFVFCVPQIGEDFSVLKDSVSSMLRNSHEIPEGIDALSLSFGSSDGHCEKYEDFTKLMIQADDNMYSDKESKKAGRA